MAHQRQNGHSDAELVRRYIDGDERAFSEVYKRYARYIASIAFQTMGSNEHVDDIVQDTFVAASTSLASLQDGAKLKSWLGTIAVRTARRKIRHLAKRRTLTSTLSALRNVFSMRPEAGAGRMDIQQQIQVLPDKYRIPWVLQRLAGYEIDEVAELCEVSSATVKRRVAEAETRLRKVLDDDG